MELYYNRIVKLAMPATPAYIQTVTPVNVAGFEDFEFTPDLIKPFDGLAAGVFTSMSGRRVVFKPDDLPEYVANTKRALESTRDSSGQIVGFPIDPEGHNGEGGAGWITDVYLSNDGRHVIKYIPRWTSMGTQLIEEDLKRFFSSTVDVKNKVIIGGTLTNYPATRLESGEILLRPIELGMPLNNNDLLREEMEEDAEKNTITVHVKNASKLQQMLQSINLKKIIEDAFARSFPPANLQETNLEERNSNDMPKWLIELLSRLGIQADNLEAVPEDQVTKALEAEVQTRVEAEVARRAREAEVDALGAQIIGGTPELPLGLPITLEAFKAFMISLDNVQYGFAVDMFKAIHTKGFIQFSEQGVNGEGSGKVELPPEVVKRLDSGELELKDLSHPILGLGDVSRFDLRKWQKKTAAA